MEGVEFEQDNIDFTMKRNIKEPATFSTFLVKKGIAANEGQANVILLILGLVLLTISVFLVMSSLKSPSDEVEYQISEQVSRRLPTSASQTNKRSN
jgi:hypothetical protein